ncbi:baseplate J/gp47 family protein [Desulfoluna spongiiphila]|uniref:baseplate J/gp47 family protein n=1 Tax=Desulfoluna spongiiphila TaxID=419481 RepID=UPI00125A21CA|nr:baseplate J/gp47 family protein [Desulfoluna spongiiphila]VVS92754.1 baseplate protein j-like [Desulfoluna spongiiphila]
MAVPIPRVSKTLDECRQMVFGRVSDVHDEYIAKGWLPREMNLNKGVVRGILEVMSWSLHQVYLLLADQVRLGIPGESHGTWLDLHADQVEAPRQAMGKAKGMVLFTREASSGNVSIAKGRIVRTQPDGTGKVHRFVTTEDAVMQNEDNEVAVPVESEDYGASANVTPGQISVIVTPIPGVDAVTNRSGWLLTEGVDTESDTSLKERYRLQWKGNDGYSSNAYKRWATSVPGVLDVAVNDQHPRGQGTVDIVIRGMAGMPTDELLDKVREAIAPNAHQNDDWQVLAPSPVHVAISLVLHLKPEAVWEEIRPTADSAVRTLFAKPDESAEEDYMFGVGEDMTQDRVVGAIMNVSPHIKEVEWLAPTTNITVGQSGLAILTGLTLTHVMEPEA